MLVETGFEVYEDWRLGYANKPEKTTTRIKCRCASKGASNK
jgi:hypothetical protein